MEPRSRPWVVPLGPALVVLAVGAAVLLFAWSMFETRKQAAEIRSVTSQQGAALVEALGHAVENALASSREVEELSAARLLDTARLLARLDRATPLENADLNRIVSDLSLHRIALLDADLGEIAAGGRAADPQSFLSAERGGVLRELARGGVDEVILEPSQEPGTGVVRLGAAVRRSRRGLVLVLMDGGEMLSFQEATGVSSLMDAVAATGGVVQVLLQDDAGTVVAQTTPKSPASNAPPLVFDHEVVVAPGRTHHLRIVLSGEALAAAGRAARRRTLASATIALGLTVALGTVFTVRRRAERIRSVTDAVLEGMDDAVVVVGSDGAIQHINPAACRLFARDAASLIGAPCRTTPCAPLREVLSDGGGPREVRLERPSAPAVLVLASASPVHDERHRTFGTAFLLRDLTETKRLELEARRSESLAAFGRLAATVAHEVRNPLNAISVGVQRLAAEFTPPSGAAEQLRLVHLLRGEIERLDGIVRRFLDLGRPPDLTPVPGDLDAHLQGMFALLSDGAPSGVRVELLHGRPLAAVFDPAALRQILLNLVRNAVEAVGPAGTVRVSAFEEGGRAVVEVADDGPGIATADLDRVFEFGFTTKPAGHGLGIPIVHRLATEMDGGVAITSVPGRGTTVRVTLPLAAQARLVGIGP